VRPSAALAITSAALTCGHDAHAQVRWDAELEDGLMRRVLDHKPAGANDATFGPTLDAAVHLALVPLIRVGAYGHYDACPVSGEVVRTFVSGGLDARVLVPWLRGDLRGYARVGLGEAGVLEEARAGGHFTEVPVAVGALYRVRRRVWVTAEIGARLGFGFGGAGYAAQTNGEDPVGVFLDLGVMWGR